MARTSESLGMTSTFNGKIERTFGKRKGARADAMSVNRRRWSSINKERMMAALSGQAPSILTKSSSWRSEVIQMWASRREAARLCERKRVWSSLQSSLMNKEGRRGDTDVNGLVDRADLAEESHAGPDRPATIQPGRVQTQSLHRDGMRELQDKSHNLCRERVKPSW